MDVRLPDGTIIQNVPDNVTRQELDDKLKASGKFPSLFDAPPQLDQPQQATQLEDGEGSDFMRGIGVAAMARSGESLLALKSAMHKLPQTLINVTVPEGFVLEQSDPVQQESQRVQALLEGRGRLVLRPSGTEPLIRIMIEGADAAENQRLAEGIADVIRTLH